MNPLNIPTDGDASTTRRIDPTSRPRLRVNLEARAAALLEKPATRGDLQAATDRIIKAIVVSVSAWSAVAIAVVLAFVTR